MTHLTIQKALMQRTNERRSESEERDERILDENRTRKLTKIFEDLRLD